MKKLKNTEILTKQVYLNIEKENGEVDTLSLSTEKAIADYGELYVKRIGEPHYSHEGGEEGANDSEGRKSGLTDLVLR